MSDRIDMLEKLAKLRADGTLTDAEFEAAKAGLLNAETAESERSGFAATPTSQRKTWAFFAIGLLLLSVASVIAWKYFATSTDLEIAVPPIASAPAVETEPGEEFVEGPPVVATGIVHKLSIDDELLLYANRGEADPLQICVGDEIHIHNQSSKKVHLFDGPEEDGDNYSDLEWLESGGTVKLAIGNLGTSLISGTASDGTPNLDLFRYQARNCASQPEP